MKPMKTLIGHSPLTDPRSLGSSIGIHAFLLFLASIAVLSVAGPDLSTLPRTLRGELEPTDNRVAPSKEGGGAPGQLGGTSLVELPAKSSSAAPSGPASHPSADSLLTEILPTQGVSDSVKRALPGPQTTGVGVLPGPGTGGGGGSGGGSGGGVGRGVGPGTEFFGASERANSFTYVIDCSGSMATKGSLEIAKRELMASLNQLPPDARFGVVFYNLKPTVFTDQRNLQALMAATAANKERVRTQLSRIEADGGTDHMSAIRAAFALQAEVIFFLTDADLMTDAEVDQLLTERGKTRIQAVEFGRGADFAGDDAPLSRLAKSSGGEYRYIDVTRFAEP